jgi:hypothetical protein
MNATTPEQAENAAPQPTETQPVTQEASNGGLPPLSDTPLDKIDQLMAENGKPAEQQEPAAEPTTTAQDAAQTETQAGDTPPANPEARSKVLPNRITTAQFTDIEQEAIALGKQYRDAGEEAPPLEDRIAIVKTRRAEHAAANPPEPEPEEVLGEVDMELAEAIAEKDELVKSLGIEEYDAKNKRIAELERKKSEAENAKTQKANLANDAFTQARNASIEKAKHIFPSSKDPQSELGQEIQSLITEIRTDQHHPDRSILSATNAPVLVAQSAAQRLAERRAEASGRSVAAELTAMMEATPYPLRNQEPRPNQAKITTAGGAASIPPAATNAKALDLSSPESMNLAAIEKAQPTRRPQGFLLRQ